MKKIITLLFIQYSIISYTQVAFIKDLNTNSSSRPPGNFIGFNDLTYFNGYEPNTGNNLWITDGTKQGTSLFLVDRLIHGTSLIIDDLLYVYMSGKNNGSSDRELYKTDGTPEGTVLIKNINATWHSDLEHMINLNGILVFSADNGIHGKELWRSDGTENGTYMIKDINPEDNFGNNGSSEPAQFIKFNNKLYFYAYNQHSDGSYGASLWSTDGTTSGTIKIKELGFSTTDYNNFENGELLVKSENALYFSNYEDETGRELWRSDGTENGTFLLKDINTSGNNTFSSNPVDLIDINGTLYFQAQKETTNDNPSDFSLWKSDGTENGTIEITNIWPGSSPFWNRNRNFIKFNNMLYFVASDETTGAEIWKSDGTESGTVIVKDINKTSIPGQAFASNGPKQLSVINDILYFAAFNGVNEMLYQTDGSSIGTKPVSIVNSNNNIISPKNIAVANGKLFFSGDNNPKGGGVGDALWSTVNSNLNIESFDNSTISIYPNPTENILNLVNSNSELINKIELFDILGNKFNPQFSNSIINLSKIKKGVYFLKIKSDKGVFSKKIIKK